MVMLRVVESLAFSTTLRTRNSSHTLGMTQVVPSSTTTTKATCTILSLAFHQNLSSLPSTSDWVSVSACERPEFPTASFNGFLENGIKSRNKLNHTSHCESYCSSSSISHHSLVHPPVILQIQALSLLSQNDYGDDDNSYYRYSEVMASVLIPLYQRCSVGVVDDHLLYQDLQQSFSAPSAKELRIHATGATLSLGSESETNQS